MDALTLLKQDIRRWNQWRASCDYQPCSLANQDLSKGFFFEGDFRGVDLSGATLEGAYVIGANFQGVNLRGANLRRACLDRADFKNADLRDADFTGAHLTRADLRNVKVGNTIFVNAKLAQVKTNRKAQKPVQNKPVSVQEKYNLAVPEKSQTTSTSPQLSQPPLPNLASASRTVETPVTQDQSLVAGSQVGNEAATPGHETSKQGSNLSPQAKTTWQSSEQKSKSRWGLNLAIGASAAIGVVAVLVVLFVDFESLQSPEEPITQLSTEPEATSTSESIDAQFVLASSIVESSPIWALATSASGEDEIVISGDEEGQITIRDRESEQIVRTWTAHADAVRDIAIAPNQRRLISVGGDGVKVWSLAGELLSELPSSAPVWSVAIAPDESRFISSNYDGKVTVWELATGKSLYSIDNNAIVWSVAISPTGDSFVSGGSDCLIHQWDLETGQLLRTFTGHQSDVRALAISPDGETLASGSWDSTVKLWSLETGELQATLEGHDDRVVTLSISHDGQTLASGSVDTEVRLWNLSDYQLVDRLDTHSDWILSTTFAPQNRILITSGKDKEI